MTTYLCPKCGPIYKVGFNLDGSGPYCDICSSSVEPEYRFTKDLPTEPGWYWVLATSYNVGNWGIATNPWVRYFQEIDIAELRETNNEHPDEYQFARVVPHPPLPKEK